MAGRSLSANLATTGKTCNFHLQEIFLVPICVRGCVDSEAVVRPEGLSQRKVSVAPPGMKPTALWLVAQCLNQLRHSDAWTIAMWRITSAYVWSVLNIPFLAFILSLSISVTDQLPVIWHQYCSHLVKFKDPDISADTMDDLFKRDAVTVLYLTNSVTCFRFISCVCTFQVPAIQLSWTSWIPQQTKGVVEVPGEADLGAGTLRCSSVGRRSYFVTG